jgi:hypothetical protein
MNTTKSELPKELEKFIQAKVAVLREELVIEGKAMTVAQVAREYRNWKAIARLYAALAFIASLMLAGVTYWYNNHPVERTVVVSPVNLPSQDSRE